MVFICYLYFCFPIPRIYGETAGNGNRGGEDARDSDAQKGQQTQCGDIHEASLGKTPRGTSATSQTNRSSLLPTFGGGSLPSLVDTGLLDVCHEKGVGRDGQRGRWLHRSDGVDGGISTPTPAPSGLVHVETAEIPSRMSSESTVRGLAPMAGPSPTISEPSLAFNPAKPAATLKARQGSTAFSGSLKDTGVRAPAQITDRLPALPSHATVTAGMGATPSRKRTSSHVIPASQHKRCRALREEAGRG